MDNEELKGRLDKLIENIIENSKDSFDMKKDLDELLSIKGQLDVEPTLLNVPLHDVEKHLDCDHFDIYKTSEGILYKTKGGYSLFVKKNNKSLHDTLMSFIEENEHKIVLNEEEQKLYELDMDANGYILSLPLFVFEDEVFKLNIATMIVDHLRQRYERLTSELLQDEDKEKDEDFKNAVIALDEVASPK